MAKNKRGDWSTCFEKLPFAERMRELMSRQGVGSLCAEIMRNLQKQHTACSSLGSEIMREKNKKSAKSNEEVRHGKHD